jgi:uncharacterized protein YceK
MEAMRLTLMLGAMIAGVTLSGCIRVITRTSTGDGPDVSVSSAGQTISTNDEGNGMSSVEVGNNNLEVKAAGPTKSEDRPVSPIHGVRVYSIIRLMYSRGPESTVRISAQENVLPHVTVEVKEGVLAVDLAPGNYHHLTSIVVTVTSPSLDSIELSGASQSDATGIEADKLRLSISGNSTLHALGSCKDLDAEISGAASLSGQIAAERTSYFQISGNASANVLGPSHDSVKGEISGSGSLTMANIATDALDLTLSGTSQSTASGSARSAQVTAEGASQAEFGDLAVGIFGAQASGASKISVEATKTLKAEASGAANIEYTGHATVESSASGAGHISPR